MIEQTPSVSNQDVNSNLQLMVDLGTAKFEYIFGAIENIESKSGVLLGFMGVIGTLSVTNHSDVFGPVKWLNIISGAFFCISMGLLLCTLIGKKYRIDPEIVCFTEKYQSSQTDDFKLQLIANIGDSVTQNLKTLENKARGFNWGLMSLGFSIGCLILSYFGFLNFFCGG